MSAINPEKARRTQMTTTSETTNKSMSMMHPTLDWTTSRMRFGFRRAERRPERVRGVRGAIFGGSRGRKRCRERRVLGRDEIPRGKRRGRSVAFEWESDDAQILEALSDQAIADDAEEQIEAVEDGEKVADKDGFVVEHDHGDPNGHRCKPMVGLRGLETLRKHEKLKEAHERGLNRDELKKNPEGLLEREAAYIDAEETRIGYGIV